MDRNFGGVIWTNHALQRLEDRGIKQGDAWVTWRRPEQSRYAREKGVWIYYRAFPASPRLRKTGGNQRIEVVAKQNEKKEWIILSVWSRYIFEKKHKEESLFRILLRKIFK